jgi:hypothetical protein
VSGKLGLLSQWIDIAIASGISLHIRSRNTRPLRNLSARPAGISISWNKAMSLAGLGAVCIWHDLLPEARDDFHQWHNREHMPERVGIPDFVAAAATLP